MENQDELMEVLYDTIENSIEFLYDRTHKKYFELLHLTIENLLNGEVVTSLNEEDAKELEKIYSPVKELDLNVESVRKALQAIILRGLKEQKLPNGSITPDTIGMIFAYLISKFEPKSRDIKLLDPLAGTGNLLFTLKNFLELNIDLYAVEHEELMTTLLKDFADMLDENVNIFFQDTLSTNFSNMDYIVTDFDSYDLNEGKYFPYEVILKYVDSLNENGVMLSLIPNDFFEFDKNQDFKKSLNEKASILGIIELPETMFNGTGKTILMIQKKNFDYKKCLLVKLPSFSDVSEFSKTLGQIETWFENNINNK